MDKNNAKNPKKPTVDTLLLTVGETARLLRLSESKIYTLLGDRYAGGIPVKRFGRSVRVSVSDLRRWVDSYPNARLAGRAHKADSQNEI